MFPESWRRLCCTTLVVAWLLVFLPGCENKNAKQAIGAGMSGVGGILVQVPFPAAQVAGCVLLASGTVLSVWAILDDGTRVETEKHLNPKEQKMFQKESTVTVTVTVKDSSGATKTINK